MKSGSVIANRKRIDPFVFAPLIFIAHFLEEAPTFVSWFNSHAAPGITAGMFWRVNLAALAITLIVVAVDWLGRSALSLVLVVAWLGFLMPANGIFHVVGAFVDRGYVPGLVTALFLYLPCYSFLFVRAVKSKLASVPILIGAAIFGAIPMATHGYLILFRGSRLF
jgi:hypothetical protein